MLILQILVIAAAVVALCAGIPQMRKLIRTRNSDEFSLKTWVMWVCTQTVAVAYAVSIGDLLLVSINGAWVLFYLAMVGLIIKYAPRPQRTTSVLGAMFDD